MKNNNVYGVIELSDLTIRLVKTEEFDDLMKLMNTAFSFEKSEEKFEHILPKLYFKENKEMIHYGAFLDGLLVASVGLYFMTFKSKFGLLKVGCVGAVSTHPDYRKNGYFTLIMKKILSYAKRHNFDMLLLTGNRFRYNHFGFENAGRKMVVGVSKRTSKLLKSEMFEVSRLDKNNLSDISDCLNLYNKQLQHILRTKDNFYNHVVSWNCVPYIVKVVGKTIGYFSIKDDNQVCEFVCNNKYLDTMMTAALGDRNEVYIELPYSLYSNKLLSKVDMYEVHSSAMFNVLNWENVQKYLGFDQLKTFEFYKMSKKERFRHLLGCDEFSSDFCKLDMFVYNCDLG